MFPIMDLPQEVRVYIFNKIVQSETPNLRLVCKQWDQEITANYNFDVSNLDENSPNFDKILEHRILNLGITQISEPSIHPSKFKHANVIRTIQINQDLPLNSNLNFLLQNCSKNLTKFTITVQHSLFLYRFHPKLSYNFENLKTLEIRSWFSLEEDYDDEETIQNGITLFQLFKNSSAPKLKRFVLQIYSNSGVLSPSENTKFHLNFLRFLIKNGQNLETLHVDLDIGTDFNSDVQIHKKELDLLRKRLIKLKSVHIYFEPIGPANRLFWQELLANQRNIVSVKVDLEREPLCEAPTAFYKTLIQNSSETIVDFDVQSQLIGGENPSLDLSIFENCPRLNCIRLVKNIPDENISEAFSNKVDILNFNSMPFQFTRLQIDNMNICSGELIDYLQNAAKNLQRLWLLYCPGKNNFGVSGSVLNEILNGKGHSLTDVQIKGRFNRKDVLETEKLNELFDHLGYPSQDYLLLEEFEFEQFWVKRNSPSDSWALFTD